MRGTRGLRESRPERLTHPPTLPGSWTSTSAKSQISELELRTFGWAVGFRNAPLGTLEYPHPPFSRRYLKRRDAPGFRIASVQSLTHPHRQGRTGPEGPAHGSGCHSVQHCEVRILLGSDVRSKVRDETKLMGRCERFTADFNADVRPNAN